MEDHLCAETFSDLQRTASRLVAKAWTDFTFYQQLVDNPNEVLRAVGLTLEDFVQVVDPALTLQGAENLETLLPSRPRNIKDEELDGEVDGQVAFLCLCIACRACAASC